MKGNNDDDESILKRVELEGRFLETASKSQRNNYKIVFKQYNVKTHPYSVLPL
jgi:hypothetical protein